MNTNTKADNPQLMAQGMTNIYDEVSTSVASAIKQDLMNHFDKGLYYRMKNGEKNITPEQQTYIAEIFEKHGATNPPVYDRMITN